MRRVAALVTMLLLSACQTVQGLTPEPFQPGATATQGVELVPSATPAFISATDQPLSFTFPEPAPAAVTIWRPPLYDTPWALGAYDHFLFQRPISVDEINWPLANYRYGYFFSGTSVVHTGIDIDASRGTSVLAAGDGDVVWAGYGLFRGIFDSEDPYGLAVTIRHDFGYQGKYLYTVYGHMDSILVKEGQEVRTGDEIGTVGNTGNTTGPHLHFEVRLQDNDFFVTRNPELWLAPPQGWGVLVGRFLKGDGTPINNGEVTVRSLDTSQTWLGRTYGPVSVNSDDYYRENFVLSDLPEGEYSVSIKLYNADFRYQVSIHPGAVTYFTYRHRRGYNNEAPAPPADEVWPTQPPFS